MAHPSKAKGTKYETELVEAFRVAGLRAKRAWGSNGCTLTTDDGIRCTSDVDILVEGRLRLQAKRRKQIAQYIKPPEGAHVALVREDRGETMAVIPLPLFLRLLARVYQPANTGP